MLRSTSKWYDMRVHEGVAFRMGETARFMIVTWDGGGNNQPALGLGRLLAANGHAVRILVQRGLQERVEAAGCEFRPLPSSLEFDPALGRSWEDPGQARYVNELFTGALLTESVLDEVERRAPDVLVVDFILRNALSAAEKTGLPTAGLVHTQRRFFSFPEATDPEGWGWDFDLVNATRVGMNLEPIPRKDRRAVVELLDRCAVVLSVIPVVFEEPDDEVPANVRHVGPVFEEDDEKARWESPWPADAPGPLVVVSLSTTYMHHETTLERVLSALDGLPVRALVTLGGGLEPEEVMAPPGVVVDRYVPHIAVLPSAALVITHAGMGTIMASFAAGVPMICMPIDRDQPLNADRVQALGAGRTVAAGATVEEIRQTILGALASEALRAGARRMAEVVASYRRGAQAVEAVESLT